MDLSEGSRKRKTAEDSDDSDDQEDTSDSDIPLRFLARKKMTPVGILTSLLKVLILVCRRLFLTAQTKLEVFSCLHFILMALKIATLNANGLRGVNKRMGILQCCPISLLTLPVYKSRTLPHWKNPEIGFLAIVTLLPPLVVPIIHVVLLFYSGPFFLCFLPLATQMVVLFPAIFFIMIIASVLCHCML